MPTYQIKAPNGKTYHIDGPAGASDADVQSEVMRQFPDAAPPSPPKAKPDTSRLQGFLLGATKALDNASDLAVKIPGVRVADSWLDSKLGLPNQAELVARHEIRRQNNARPGYQALGNIGGTLPTLALRGGAAIQGAATGALLSDKKGVGGRLFDAGVGAASGAIGKGALDAAGYALKPVVSKGAQLLRQAGVPLTLGQLASGGKGLLARATSSIEEGMTSIPFLGDAVTAARDRGVVAFNRSRLSKALAAGTGKALPEDMVPGKAAIAHVGDRLSEGFESVVPNLSAAADPKFLAGAANVKREYFQTLPPALQQTFSAVLQAAVANKSNGGKISGKALQTAERIIKQKADRYSGSAVASEQELGAALKEIHTQFYDWMIRQNPKYAKSLQGLRAGWAELATIEKAAGGQGNHTGLFTPKGYAAAARAADTSVRKRATTRGTARDQETIDAAGTMLSNTLPDSGTAKRGMIGLGVLAGGAKVVNPALAVPAAMMASYTKTGQRALNSFVFKTRPKSVQQAGELLKLLGKGAPLVVPPLLARKSRPE